MTDTKPKTLTPEEETAIGNFLYSSGYVTGILLSRNEDELSEKIAETIQLLVEWKKEL